MSAHRLTSTVCTKGECNAAGAAAGAGATAAATGRAVPEVLDDEACPRWVRASEHGMAWRLAARPATARAAPPWALAQPQEQALRLPRMLPMLQTQPQARALAQARLRRRQRRGKVAPRVYHWANQRRSRVRRAPACVLGSRRPELTAGPAARGCGQDFQQAPGSQRTGRLARHSRVRLAGGAVCAGVMAVPVAGQTLALAACGAPGRARRR